MGYTELFSDAMRTLVDGGIVTNKHLRINFFVSSIFLSGDSEAMTGAKRDHAPRLCIL